MTTAVMTQPDEIQCEKTLEVWESISPDHLGHCIYGNFEELNLEQFKED